MKAQEVKALTDAQMQEKVMLLRKEQMNLRFQKASGTLENPNRVREIRKDVARIKTEMSARKSA